LSRPSIGPRLRRSRVLDHRQQGCRRNQAGDV